LLIVYALAAGLQPQIVRASVMAILGLTAYLFQRDPDALSALSLSGIAYLLWRPDAVYGMAFQLSFITVACIAMFFERSPYAPGPWKAQIVRGAKEFLKLSGVVTLATAPLIAYYIGSISTVSVFANMLLFWSLPLVIGLAFIAHGASLATPPVGDAVAVHFLAPLGDGLHGVLGWVGDGSGTIQVPGFSALWLVAFYGAWLTTYRRRVVQP
jgi:competence protein ComEC